MFPSSEWVIVGYARVASFVGLSRSSRSFFGIDIAKRYACCGGRLLHFDISHRSLIHACTIISLDRLAVS